MGGEDNLLDIEVVSNVVHRDDYFLSTVDTNITGTSPATQYLDIHSYLTENGLLEKKTPI